ncbi:MAG: carbohydrate kinase [Chloroflexota bacterium]
MSRVVVAGESLVDLIVDAGGGIRPAAGGGPYNAARTLGRLGIDVAFLGRLSTDRFGREMHGHLAADGVGLSLVVDTDDPTTLALAELDAAGAASYRFYVDGTSAPGLTLADARRALTPDLAVLHAGTLGLVLEPMADALATLVAEAPAGVLRFIDPNCRPSIVRDEARYRARLDAVLAHADVIKVSTDDLDWLVPGTDPVTWANERLAAGAGAVLITAGGDGVTVVSDAGVLTLPAVRVPVVDTVGAGDSFGGGFLAWWLDHGLSRAELADGAALRAATEQAIRVAAITCTRAGAEPPTRADLDAFAG